MVVQLERGLWSAGKGAVGEGVDRGAVGVGVGTGNDKLSIVQGKLQVANEQLSSCRAEMERLSEEKELRIEELQAEVALLRA